jgi:TP901 family phage tail tape measure protein
LAEDLIAKYIFKAEGIEGIKAQAAQLGGYLQAEGQKGGAAFSKSFKSTLSPSSLMGTAGTLAAGAVVAAPLAFVAAAGAATNASIKWEAEMANVQKTAGAATDVAALGDSLLQLSTIPGMPAKEDLASIAEMAGSLGVDGTQNVETFTEAVAHATSAFGGLTAGETATQLAKMENVFGIDVSQTENLASAIDWVGNNLAATEAETMAAMQKMSGLGAMYGMTASEAAGFGGSLIALGMDADSAGTLTSSLMTKITDPAMWGKAGELVGMTAEEFGSLATTDVDSALLDIASALEQIEDPMERASAIADLKLGTEAAKPLLKMVGHTEEIRANMEGAGEAFEEGVGAMTTFNAKAETSSALITAIGHQVGVIAVGFGSSIRDSETFHSVLEGVYGTLDKVITNMDTIKGLASHLGEDLKSGLSWLYEVSPLDEIASAAGSADEKWNISDRIWGSIKEYAGTAGEESGEEFTEGLETGTEDITENIETELEDIDAEGAGKDAGEDFAAAFLAGTATLEGGFTKLAMDSMHTAGMMYNYATGQYESRSGGVSSKGVASIQVGSENPLTVEYKLYNGRHILNVRDNNGNLLASEDWGFTSGQTLDETIVAMLAQIVDRDVLRASQNTALESITPEQRLQLEGEVILDVAENVILNPYERWGSPQHLADWFAENADIIETGGETLGNQLYFLWHALKLGGKEGWEDAWAIIFDPDATEQQLDNAIDLLDLSPGAKRIVENLRDTLGDIDAAAAFEELFTEEIPISFASMIKAGLTDFNEIFEDVGSQAVSAFNNGISAEEATSIASLYAELKETDREKFEKMGGDDMLSWWLGAQELLDARNLAASVGSDTSQLDAELDAYFATYDGHVTVTAEVNAFGGPLAQGPVDEDGNPITLASLLFGTDAERRKEIEREDLWFKNTVMPLTEDHIDKMLEAATSGYEDDYQAAKANAELLYDLQDEYGQKYLTLRQNQLITALRQGEIGIMAFNEQWDKLNEKQDESKKKVDELSDKYGNLAKTTAESMDDCCEAMSAFGKAQEASSDMFFGSYIGPTENYVPWLVETGEYDKRISVGFDFPDDIDQKVAEYLAAHPVEGDITLVATDDSISESVSGIVDKMKLFSGENIPKILTALSPPSDDSISEVIGAVEDIDSIIVPGAELNQDDLYNIVTEINSTDTAIPVGLNASQFWRDYSSIVRQISNWKVYIPVDVSVVANVPALVSQIKAEILRGLQS